MIGIFIKPLQYILCSELVICSICSISFWRYVFWCYLLSWVLIALIILTLMLICFRVSQTFIEGIQSYYFFLVDKHYGLPLSWVRKNICYIVDLPFWKPVYSNYSAFISLYSFLHFKIFPYRASNRCFSMILGLISIALLMNSGHTATFETIYWDVVFTFFNALHTFLTYSNLNLIGRPPHSDVLHIWIFLVLEFLSSFYYQFLKILLPFKWCYCWYYIFTFAVPQIP